MDNFPFTKKKFLTLPPARRHKWITLWLKQIYEDLIADRLTDKTLELFYRNYKMINSWMQKPFLLAVQLLERQNWIEFVSDRFHEHQKQRGLGLSEPDFLPRVLKGDKGSDDPLPPRLTYKVALDNLRSAFNIGSIFRLIDAAGFESVIMGQKTPGKEHHQVSKTAMGSQAWIPQEKADNLSEKLSSLKNAGYQIIGVETVENSWTYLEFPWPEKGVVVLGNEEYGLSKNVMTVCDEFVHLPMFGKKNSLNVANAFAVIAFHICSQRVR